MAISIEHLASDSSFTQAEKGKFTLLPDPPSCQAPSTDHLGGRPHRGMGDSRVSLVELH